MKVRILDRDHSSGCFVFGTAIGNGRARWGTKTFTPDLGEEYDVEFQIGVSLEPGVTAVRINEQRASLESRDKSVVFVGQVESVDEDGMLYLRLATDCLLMVEARLGAVRVGEWWALEVGARDCTMFAIGR